MDIDLIIEKLIELRKQGVSRVFLREASHFRLSQRRFKIDRDNEGDGYIQG